MSEMMKAFVMHAIGQIGVIEKPIPRPGPNDAIIRTTAALICTSDTHTVAGAIGDRHDLTLGHEAVRVIRELANSLRHQRIRIPEVIALTKLDFVPTQTVTPIRSVAFYILLTRRRPSPPS